MARRKKQKLSDEIRRAMDDCGVTRYAISKATGIDQSVLSKFHHGQRGMSLASLDVLAEHLDLHIVQGKRKRS